MQEELGKYIDFRIEPPLGSEEMFTHFYFASNHTSESITKTLLPSYQTILIFTFGVKASLVSKEGYEIETGNCLVLGPVKQAFDYVLPSGSEILVVNFTGDAFYRFFGEASVAMHQPMNPDALLEENCFTDLWLRLNEISEAGQRISHILDFCMPYLKERNDLAGQLAGFKDDGRDAVKTIAGLNNQTARNIQLIHKKHLGFSAKEFSRYRRFLNAVGILQENVASNVKTDWFELIDACGYYDQSQLIRDFKHYINLSPTQYLKFQQHICSAKS